MNITQQIDKNEDPWTRNREQQPPDLEEILKKTIDWLSSTFFSFKDAEMKKGKMPSPNKSLGYIIGIAVFLIYFIMGLYVVAPAERAVKTRFGAYVSTQLPGMHWKMTGFEKVDIINVEQISQLNYHAEMLTQDENYVDVDVSVMYRVLDPMLFLFSAVNPKETVYQAAGSAARQAAGQRTLEKIITTGRADIRASIESQLNNILDVYKMGIEIVDVKLQDAKPPHEVQEAFDDAIKAREDEQRYINKAMAYRSEVIPASKGEAFQIINEAQAYANQVVQSAKAEASLFQADASVYMANPTVQTVRMKTKALEDVLKTNPKVISNSKNGLNVLSIADLLQNKLPEIKEGAE